jgi:biotin transport system substrate-specific component
MYEKGVMKTKLRNLVRCGCCGALITVCAWLAVPVGDIAITMQTFGVFLTLLLLGGGKGTAACAVYLTLGAVGLPVFSGFQGGLGVLLGPTGGYLWGFLILCLCYRMLHKPLGDTVSLLLGLLLCYGCGSIWFYAAYGGHLPAVLLKCVVPYLLPDALKLILALEISKRIRL